ncbi:MAG: lipoyl(octanoyl) transferase LipB [Planctomycetes bacterium]|nr:lipoyl(octanoyl) transferase LipB [Planctomycetota bacterium]
MTFLNSMTTKFDRKIIFVDLGLIEYADALELQRETLKKRLEGSVPDTVYFCEHPKVFTVGSERDDANVLFPREHLESLGYEFFETDRGGAITLHEPGQMVVYPILALENYRKDLHWYLRSLEQTVIKVLARVGIFGNRDEAGTGVWSQMNKICAIGVKCSRWITMHGIALNVTNSMEGFNLIVPCGIQGRGVTSVQKLAPGRADVESIKELFREEFTRVFLSS